MNLLFITLSVLFSSDPANAGIFNRIFGGRNSEESPSPFKLKPLTLVTTTVSPPILPRPDFSPKSIKFIPIIAEPLNSTEKNVKPAPQLPVAAEEMALGKIHDANKPKGMIEEPGVKVQGHMGVVFPEGAGRFRRNN